MPRDGVVANVYCSPPHSEAAEELVAQGLCLSDGAQATVVHLLCVQLHAALWELEPLLHD